MTDSTCRLTLMGPPALRREQRRQRLPFAGATRRLFLLLAAHANRALRRELALDTVWPDEPVGRANSALNTAVWRIRGVTADFPGVEVEVIDDTLRLAVQPPARVDAHELETSVKAAVSQHHGGGLTEETRARLQAALEDCRGTFLEGCAEHWVLPLRERYAALHIQAISFLLRDAAAQGDYETALHYGRWIIELDPFREGTQREVMWLYALSGQRARAIRQYHDLQAMLQRELAIAPMPETQFLYRRIVEARHSLSPDLAHIRGPVWPVDDSDGRAGDPGTHRG